MLFHSGQRELVLKGSIIVRLHEKLRIPTDRGEDAEHRHIGGDDWKLVTSTLLDPS